MGSLKLKDEGELKIVGLGAVKWLEKGMFRATHTRTICQSVFVKDASLFYTNHGHEH